MCRELEGYCHISFPHCECDARKEGHVIVSLSSRCLSLNACSVDGVPEVRFNIGKILELILEGTNFLENAITKPNRREN